MIKFDVLNIFSGRVQFTAEIDCIEDCDKNWKLRLAILWAIKNDAYLRDADLEGANLSYAYLIGADLHNANLRGADLRGADLRKADLRKADLRGANLSYADLIGADLHNANLRGADLRGANLRDADLRKADLRKADLRGADLSGADLSGANLRDCPVKIENIHQKVYEAASQDDALDMSDWHICETTHCRAGWVVHLAGDEGKKLEKAMGTSAAAAIIYMNSDPDLEKIPDFYCDNDEALADMKRLAEKEAA